MPVYLLPDFKSEKSKSFMFFLEIILSKGETFYFLFALFGDGV